MRTRAVKIDLDKWNSFSAFQPIFAACHEGSHSERNFRSWPPIGKKDTDLPFGKCRSWPWFFCITAIFLSIAYQIRELSQISHANTRNAQHSWIRKRIDR
jgi:hypothetical protein